METNEELDRQKYGDPRIYRAMIEARKNDKSFTEKNGFLGLPIKYSQVECREFWFQAIEIGIREGLRIGSIEGQRIDLYNNCTEQRQKDFLEKFYKLAEEYNCAVVYHPVEGMVIKDLKPL